MSNQKPATTSKLGISIGKSFLNVWKNNPESLKFALKCWPTLAKRTVVVDEDGKNLLNHFASSGALSPLDLEVKQNSRCLHNHFVASGADEISSFLIFLDSNRLPEQLEELLHVRKAADEHGQIIHFNGGALHWLSRQSASSEKKRRMSVPGPDDAIMLIGENSRDLPSFAGSYRNTILKFPQRVMMRETMAAVIAQPIANPAPGKVVLLAPGRLDIASNIVKRYPSFPGGGTNDGRQCHVIVCSGDSLEPSRSMKQFLQVCLNSKFHTNVLTTKPTAEDWMSSMESEGPALIQ